MLAWKTLSQNNSKKSAVVLTALLSGLNMNKIKCAFLVAGSFLLFACSSGVREDYAMNYQGQIGDPIMAIAMLSEQQ